MNFASRSIVVVVTFLAGCAGPQIDDLRSQSPNAQFQVNAPIECLYDKGVEHASSYLGMSEPKFSWYIDSNRKYAWFRQPLTLVELRSIGPSSTEVRRSQTSSADALGQGGDLLAYLSSGQCSSK